MGRFTFPAGASRTLLLEAGSGSTEDFASAKKDVSTIELTGNTASGALIGGHFCGNGPTYKLYFAMQFSQPFAQTGGYDAALHPGATSAQGYRAGSWVIFANGSEPILMKVGLSYVSIENARENLQKEAPTASTPDFNADFNTMRHAAEQTWSAALHAIETAGGTPDQRVIFYTGLYHSLLSPNIFSDANGDYIDFDQKIRRLNPGEQMYTNFSDWDTAHDVVQLQSLLFPKQTSQMMQSLVRDAEQNGMFPRWTAANFVSWVMSGDAPAILLANAYAFGARDFDTHTALRYMLQAATAPAPRWWNGGQERLHMDQYLAKGYVSLDNRHDVYAASATLDFNNADFAVSRMAQALGDKDSAHLLLAHAQSWRTLWDKDSRLIRPRERDGSFLSGWNPEHYLPRYDRLSALGFEEGSAYQYTYSLPFNYAGLIQAMGGRNAAIPQFDKFFEKVVGWNTPNFTTTNEPDFGEEYLYDWLGQPSKTQHLIPRILATFTTKPDGLPGNDDLGATSALYLWDAMGIYPVIPGLGGFAIGTPLFSHSLLTLGNGRTLDIEAHGTGVYVQSLTLNGRTHPSTWLPLSELIARRNRLIFTLGDRPNPDWGTHPADAPPSFDTSGDGRRCR
jgi:predicted alpha-1,2-mannosidase